MKCNTCQYPLWNLESRTCPECGTPYNPSDYDFTLNSVQFICPGCRQSYYGTGMRGHLVPREFDCVRCARHLRMDEMILLPTEGVEEERTRVDYVPWCDPGSTRGVWGRFTAAVRTTYMAMIRPEALGRYLPRGSSHTSALALAVVTNLFYWTVGVGLCLGFSFVVPLLGGATGNRAMLNALLGFVITAAVFVLGLTIIPIWLWSLATHLMIRLTGPRTGASVVDTANAIAYASTANAVTAIPCVGIYVGWIWWAVSAVFTVRGVHRIGGGRASAAVLVPLALWLVVSVGGVFGLMVIGANVSANQMPVQMNTTQAQSLTDTLLRRRLEDQAWPDHGLALLDDNNIWANSYGAYPSNWTTGTITPIGDITMTELAGMTPADRAAWIDEHATLPPGTVAHRVQDVVFTYHGVDPDADPNLWVLILCPDTASTKPVYVAGTAGGMTVVIDPADIATRLSEQDALRQSQGLPPIPGLNTVPEVPVSPLAPNGTDTDTEAGTDADTNPAEADPASDNP